MFTFSGKVIKGEGRGKKIGTPTANLDNISLPLNYGIYLVEVDFDNNIYTGLLHFGPKKTFNMNISTEVYIHNFKADIYGRKLKLKVLKKIRKIIKFKNVNKLIQQIEKDKEELSSV